MKPHIQRGQPEEDCWICYLQTGCGIGPMGFGDTPEQAYEDFHFGLANDLTRYGEHRDYGDARALVAAG